MRIRILDKYIFKESLMTFFFGVCAFSAVFIGSGTLFRIAQYITDYGASVPAVVKVLIFSIPGIIVYTFPMSMLLASLMTFGRMSGTSEITAMKAGGISFYRIAAPAVLLGLLVSIFSINFNEYVVPWANSAYNNVVYYEIQGKTEPESQDHIILKEIHDGQLQRLVYARRYEAESQTMQNITMQQYNAEGKVAQVETAEYADWSGGVWTMHNGTIYDVSLAEVDRTMRFEKQTMPVNSSPKQIVREQKKPKELTMKELRAQIDIMKSQFADTKKLETELYQRVTIPLASLVFTLIGVPLGLQPNRNSSSVGFGISIVIIFVYYVFMTLSSAVAQGGALDPAFAVWIPNLVGLVVGICLMRHAAR